MKRIFLLIILIMLLFQTASFADDVKLEASLERNRVSSGNPLYLYVTFSGAQDVEVPEVPRVDGLKISYRGPSTKVSIVNGKISQSISHVFLVLPTKSGEYKIGPFSVIYNGRKYNAQPVTLVVSDQPAPSVSSRGSSAQTAPQQMQNTPYSGDNVFLVMDIPKTTVYVNEVVPLTIKLFVDGVGLKEIEYPLYEHEGFSVGEIKEPERRREYLRGVHYDVLVFKQHIFGIKEGDYVLGPAKVGCKVVTRKRRSSGFSHFGIDIDDFFGSKFGYNTYPMELEAKPVSVKILPFPKEGEPKTFQGAVGDFSMNVYVEPTQVKVGDPIVVRTTIKGIGNFDTVTSPKIQDSDLYKTYEPQVTVKENTKIYEQIIIPKTDELTDLPEVVFSYFNPKTAKYKTLKQGPFPVTVAKKPEGEGTVKLVSLPGKEEMFYPKEEIGRDIIHIKDALGIVIPLEYFLYEKWYLGGSLALILIFFVLLSRSYRKKERIQKDKGYARLLKAPRSAKKGLKRARKFLSKGDAANFYDAIFKTLQDYLGGRFNLPKGNVTHQAIEEKLASVAYDEKIINDIKDIFSRCEMARYASSVPGGEEARSILEKTKRIIDYMEKVRV